VRLRVAFRSPASSLTGAAPDIVCQLVRVVLLCFFTNASHTSSAIQLQLRLGGTLREVRLNLLKTQTVYHLKCLIHEQFGDLDKEPYLPDTLV
jgi:hypothetical protein